MTDVDMSQFARWWRELEPLVPELTACITQSLGAVTQGRDDIVGVGLYSDSDARTLIPAALSQSHRDSNSATYPEASEFYAWCPDEWDLVADRPDVLSELMGRLEPLYASVSDEDRVDFTSLMYVWMVEGMAVLVRGGWFEQTYPGVNVAFWVTDTPVAEETVIEWTQELNPPERVKAYAEWLKTHGL